MHLVTEYWFTSESWGPKDIPEDWRPWVGLMAILNLIGLGIYKLSYRYFTRLFQKRSPLLSSTISVRAMKFYGPLLSAIMLLLQIYVYYRFGGIGGFVQSFAGTTTGKSADFQGLGWLFALAESFPVLFVILCTVIFKQHLRRTGTVRLVVYIGLSFVLAMLCGGLRGSRGNTIYTIGYIIGIVHFTVRPIDRKLLGLCGIISLAFMYIYGFYKSSPQLFTDPASLTTTILSTESRSHLEKKTGRSLQAVLMGDLDRTDVQAYLLYRMMNKEFNVQLAYGRTYLEGALCYIPYGLLQYRPLGKLKYGTDAVYGEGTYASSFVSSKIYGVAGEAMLNFGPYSAPLGFILLAAAVGYARALCSRLSSTDARRYFVPIMSMMCIVCVSSDLDNVLFLLLQHAFVPFILIALCCRARHYNTANSAA
jgi:hypothetical protein